MAKKTVTLIVDANNEETLMGVEVISDFVLCDLRRTYLPQHQNKKFGVFNAGDDLPNGAIVLKRWKSKSKIKV